MSFTISIRGVVAAGLAVACAACATALIAVAPGRAQQAARTITITSGAQRLSMLDVAPKGVARGRASLGDQVFVNAPIRTDGGTRGTLSGGFTVGNAQAVPIGRASGPFAAVYRLADGDIYVQGTATFDDRDEDHGAVVGGTGAYAGARGTVDSSKARDVVRLIG
jgi:hypothetical protein